MSLLRFLPRFQKAYRELDALAARESWSRAQIDAFQLERLNRVWEQAIAHVPYYRRVRSESDLPPRFSSLEEFRQAVPLLPNARARNQSRELLSERAGRGGWHLTGGSTGSPARFYWAKDASLQRRRYQYRLFSMWGADIFDRVAFLWGHGASFAPGLEGYVARVRRPFEDWLRNRIRLSPYRMTRADLRRYLKRIAAFRPVMLYAYSTSAYLLAQEAAETGFRCPSLKFIVLTAEPAFPHIVEAVENAFDVPAIVEYGSSDCGFVAGEWPDRTLRVRDDGTLVETLPRDDGRFDIVLTLLDNPSFPLIRYVTDDVTDAPAEVPPRGFTILKNVAGRSNDLIVSGSGRFVHATLLYEIIEYEKAVRYYRLHQRADGSVRVAIQLKESGASLNADKLQRKIAGALQGRAVELEVVDLLPPSPAGKHRWIVSDLTKRCSDSKNGEGWPQSTCSHNLAEKERC